MLSPTVINRLWEIVGRENVLLSPEELVCYSYDATRHRHLPEAVVRPGTAQEVVAIVRLANEERIPITPRGAGTGLSGGSVPVNGGLVLSLTRMNQIREIAPEDLIAVIEPGVVTAHFQAEVERLGLFYPPDPASVNSCTMGGNVAESAGGLRGLKYGVTRDYLLGLELVTPQGELVHTGARTLKCVTGYDVTRLIAGSEGTLGIITGIIVELLPRPEHRVSLLATFSKLDWAAVTVSQIVAEGVIPATLEIMDQLTIRTVEGYIRLGLPQDAEALLLIETDGFKPVAESEADQIVGICRQNRARTVEKALDETQRERLWTARRSALTALARVKLSTILEDVTIPPSRIGQMMVATQHIAAENSLLIGTFGHAGDGNLHPTILTDLRDSDQTKKVERAINQMFQTALELGGTLSGEHGIGVGKRRFLKLEIGSAGLELMRRIKRALDPNGIMNPGKIVD